MVIYSKSYVRWHPQIALPHSREQAIVRPSLLQPLRPVSISRRSAAGSAIPHGAQVVCAHTVST